MILIIFCIKTCIRPSAPKIGERVIGGTPAQLGEIPYIISLKFNGNNHCGGSIINPTHILTAAHCVYGEENEPHRFEVQYGVIDSQSKQNRFLVDKIKIHEGFVMGGNFPNDVAVLKLSMRLPMGPTVAAIALPTEDLLVPEGSVTARLSGWGNNEDGQVRNLLTAEFPLWNDETCSADLDNMYDHKYHICAGDLDGRHKQCSGDSGGPLVVDGVQHGVVSWSFKPCITTNRPGVFTRVFTHIDWIQKAMKHM